MSVQFTCAHFLPFHRERVNRCQSIYISLSSQLKLILKMEGLIGIAFKDYTLIATDRSSSMSIINLKHDEKKIYELNKHLALGVSGEKGDTTQFAEYIKRNVQLFSIRNGYEMKPANAAHFIRRNLADSLRTRSPYQVNSILAGYNRTENCGELYRLDYLGTMIKTNYAAHGYASMLSLSIFDRFYKPDLPLSGGLDVLRKVISEVQKRLVISMPVFYVMVISKDGIQVLDDIVIGPDALKEAGPTLLSTAAVR